MKIHLLGLALCTTLNLYNFEENEFYDVSANPVIIDTDFCTDVDDAVALRLATTLDTLSVGSLKGICLCTTDKDGTDINVQAVNGILNYANYKDIPIGISTVKEPDTSPYWNLCAEYSIMEADTKDSLSLYKEVLSNCANRFTIVTTGYLTNIQALLQDKEGYNLVKNNCKQIVITGGTYPSGGDNNFNFTENARESIKYVNDNAPCDLVFVPNDVGGVFNAGKVLQELDPDDTVSKSITAFGSSDGRAAWDPTAVYLAFVPEKVSNFDFEYCNTQVDNEGNILFENSVEETNKKVVRRKSTISTKQYQELIEGILKASINSG